MRRTIAIAAAGLLVLSGTLFFLLQGNILVSSPDTPDPQKNPVLDQFTGHFDTSASIHYKGLEATAAITQQSPQSCIVAFSSPSSLDGMSFEFNQDAMSVNYKGLSFGFDPASVPVSAVAKMAVAAINTTLRKEGLSLDYQDDALLVGGSNESGAFTLTLDPATGAVLKLSIPDQQLEIEFTNFTFLN